MSENQFDDMAEQAAERAREQAVEFGYGKRPPGLTKIVEMVLIGAVTAGIIHLFSLPRIEERLDQLARNQERAEARYDREIGEIKHDLYVPRSGHKVALEPFQSLASNHHNDR